MTLDEMLARPGVYLVGTAYNHVLVEVSVDLKCRQLNPSTLEPEGRPLRRDRWSTQIASIAGPLYREKP